MARLFVHEFQFGLQTTLLNTFHLRTLFFSFVRAVSNLPLTGSASQNPTCPLKRFFGQNTGEPALRPRATGAKVCGDQSAFPAAFYLNAPETYIGANTRPRQLHREGIPLRPPGAFVQEPLRSFSR